MCPCRVLREYRDGKHVAILEAFLPPKMEGEEVRRCLISNANYFFGGICVEWGDVGHLLARACARLDGWLASPPPPTNHSFGNAPSSPAPELCFISTTRAHAIRALTDLKRKKVDEEDKLERAISSFGSVSCSQAASTFSITKGGAEERKKRKKWKQKWWIIFSVK